MSLSDTERFPLIPTVVRTVDVRAWAGFLRSLHVKHHSYPSPSSHRRRRHLPHDDRRPRSSYRVLSDCRSSQGKGKAGPCSQSRRHPGCSRRHSVRLHHARSGVADLGLSRTLQTFRSPAIDGSSAAELHHALTGRYGSLGWVLEGVIQSINVGDLDSATRMWGDEAIDLLWERGLLASPDGDLNHRDVALVEDAQLWASTRRAELLTTMTPPRAALHPLELLTVTAPPVERHGQRLRDRAPAVSARR